MRVLVTVSLLIGLTGCWPDAAEDKIIRAEPLGFDDPARSIGASCRCEGEDCESFGVPRPNLGAIYGCSAVPPYYAGSERVCLRSYEGSRATNTYFPNGYCGLMAIRCEGAGLICGNATFGIYGTFTRCPEGTAMMQSVQDVEIDLGLLGRHEATVYSKICVALCERNEDCRGEEFDPVLDRPGEYQCNDQDGVGFCYDPRNFSAPFTITAF